MGTLNPTHSLTHFEYWFAGDGNVTGAGFK